MSVLAGVSAVQSNARRVGGVPELEKLYGHQAKVPAHLHFAVPLKSRRNVPNREHRFRNVSVAVGSLAKKTTLGRHVINIHLQRGTAGIMSAPTDLEGRWNSMILLETFYGVDATETIQTGGMLGIGRNRMFETAISASGGFEGNICTQQRTLIASCGVYWDPQLPREDECGNFHLRVRD